MNHDDQYLVVDNNGTPDHIMNAAEIAKDGFDLACAIGASRGKQEKISGAISEMLTKYGDKAGYVLASALTQFGRDLVPMVADLAKASTGVDFAKHCEFMHGDDYDPYTVDDLMDDDEGGASHG